MTKLLTALSEIMIPAAMAAGTIKPKLFHTVEAVPAPSAVTISVEELQRHVDMRALHAMEIDNLYRGRHGARNSAAI